MTQNPHPELPHDENDPLFEDAPVTHFQAEDRHGLITGTGLGKYRILERIRNTHHAIIFKARDAMLDRLVSLKQLSPGLIDDPVACGDFKREAQLLARLSGRSRNVSHVYELIGDENGFFIAEEYIEGDWLEMQISKRIFTAADAPQILRHGCLALGALQLERIVHRDAWPGNWLVGANGRLILTNFSTATREGDASPPPLVHAKYAAPEILVGEPCDCRADIYTFGILLYEICVGRASLKAWCETELGSPKPHETVWRAWHVDFAKALPPAHEMNPDVDESLSRLIREMTKKDVDERIGSSQQILRKVNRELPGRRDKAKALGDERPKVLEIRRVGNGATVHTDPTRQGSLAWLMREDQSTTTTQVSGESARKSPRGRRITARPPVPIVLPDERPRTVVSQRVTQSSKDTTARKRLPKTPIVPPAPSEVEAPQRVRPAYILAAVVAIAVTLTIAFVGYNSYTAITDPGEDYRDTAAIVSAAEAAMNDDDWSAAQKKYEQVLLLSKGDPEQRSLYESAKSAMLLIDARKAIEADNFADAESALASAQTAGAAPQKIRELRDRLSNRRDALRNREKIEKQLASNHFEQAELSLPEYRKHAKEAGLDPDELDRKLNETREDKEYKAAVAAALDAIKAKDFEAAIVKARDARELRDVPEARHLVDKIIEAKRQYDHRLKGDRAMRERDFAAAESEYKTALSILPDDEIEKKLRTATAARLYIDANEALEQGDLLGCQRLLRNSLWQVRSTEARSMLERLTPAFEAANMVKNADRAAASGDKEKAIRLLKAAIPNLPSPSRERAQATLDRLTK